MDVIHAAREKVDVRDGLLLQRVRLEGDKGRVGLELLKFVRASQEGDAELGVDEGLLSRLDRAVVGADFDVVGSAESLVSGAWTPREICDAYEYERPSGRLG